MNLPTTDKKATLVKWRVKEGTLVNSTVVVLLYQEDGEKVRKSFRTNHIGVVKKILIHEGQEIPVGYDNCYKIVVYLYLFFLQNHTLFLKLLKSN